MKNNFLNMWRKTRRNILIVGNFEECRTVLVDMLKDSYDVDAARNGREALEFMKRQRYGLIITDLEMSEMTGIDLLKKINTFASDTKVIIACNNGTVNSYMDSMGLGASEYLNKPLELKELTKVVANVFSQIKHPW